jgi:hypothetical protein
MTYQNGFVLAGLLLCACSTARPVGFARQLNADTPAVCARHCEAMGMRLGAVVIIESAEGCVCEPARAAAHGGAAGASITPAVAAAATAAVQQEKRKQAAER